MSLNDKTIKRIKIIVRPGSIMAIANIRMPTELKKEKTKLKKQNRKYFIYPCPAVR